MRGDRVEIVVDAGGETRTGYFMAARVIALVEHPAEQVGVEEAIR